MLAGFLDTLLACWLCKPCAAWQLRVQLLPCRQRAVPLGQCCSAGFTKSSKLRAQAV